MSDISRRRFLQSSAAGLAATTACLDLTASKAESTVDLMSDHPDLEPNLHTYELEDGNHRFDGMLYNRSDIEEYKNTEVSVFLYKEMGGGDYLKLGKDSDLLFSLDPGAKKPFSVRIEELDNIPEEYGPSDPTHYEINATGYPYKED